MGNSPVASKIKQSHKPKKSFDRRVSHLPGNQIKILFELIHRQWQGPRNHRYPAQTSQPSLNLHAATANLSDRGIGSDLQAERHSVQVCGLPRRIRHLKVLHPNIRRRGNMRKKRRSPLQGSQHVLCGNASFINHHLKTS